MVVSIGWRTKTLHRKWLEITKHPSIYKWLFGVPGTPLMVQMSRLFFSAWDEKNGLKTPIFIMWEVDELSTKCKMGGFLNHQYCWWLKSSDHQLRLVVYPIIYKGVLYIQTVVGLGICEPSPIVIFLCSEISSMLLALLALRSSSSIFR